MNSANLVIFTCSSCGTKLSVPREMAHITGPCPHCHTLIQAPLQSILEYNSEIIYRKKPEPPSDLSPCRIQLDLPLEDVAALVKLPKQEIEGNSEPSYAALNEATPQLTKSNGGLTLLLIFTFLTAIGYLINFQFSEKSKQTTKETLPKIQEKPIEIYVPESLPVVEEMPAPIQIPTDTKQKPMDLVAASLLVLEEFLAVKTFEERSSLIESDLTHIELVDSILDEPLPKVLSIEVDICERRSKEQIVDTYYRVDFDQEGGDKNFQTILVRARGNAEPKVVVDPFLDLFGGKLATFATNQKAETGVFQAVILAGAYCREEIRNAQNMHCLKLLSREDASEIATAYFDKQSSIAAALEDELSGLAYGQAKACRVSLRWVAGVSSQKPYLEAIGLESMHWNP